MLGAQIKYWDRKRHPERYSGDNDEKSDFICKLNRASQRILLLVIFILHFIGLPVYYYYLHREKSPSSYFIHFLCLSAILLNEICIVFGIMGLIKYCWRSLMFYFFFQIFNAIIHGLIAAYTDECFLLIHSWPFVILELAISLSMAIHIKKSEQAINARRFRST